MGDQQATQLDPTQYNMRSPGVKRLMKEAAELRNPTDMYYAQPLEDNLFEWHFTVRGPADTDFDGGVYHGRILLPPDYPMKPPSVILLTPNGRFQLNQKICLSISGYHPESWQPSWSIRTALLALIGFMPTHSAGALGSLEYPPVERKRLAALSRDWVCKDCGLCMRDALACAATSAGTGDADEARELAKQITFKGRNGSSATALDEFGKDGGDQQSAAAEVPAAASSNGVASLDGAAGASEGLETLSEGDHPRGLAEKPATAAADSGDAATAEPVRQRANVASPTSASTAVREVSSRLVARNLNDPTRRAVVSATTVASTTQSAFSWQLIMILILGMAFAALLYRRLTGVQGGWLAS